MSTKGYRGHDAQNPHSVFISGQKRGAFGTIKRELRRRSAIDPIIGHLKGEGHLRRCYLKSRAGDARQGHPPNRRPQLPPRPHLGQRTLGPVPRIAMPIAPLSSPAQPGFLANDTLPAGQRHKEPAELSSVAARR